MLAGRQACQPVYDAWCGSCACVACSGACAGQAAVLEAAPEKRIIVRFDRRTRPPKTAHLRSRRGKKISSTQQCCNSRNAAAPLLQESRTPSRHKEAGQTKRNALHGRRLLCCWASTAGAARCLRQPLFMKARLRPGLPAGCHTRRLPETSEGCQKKMPKRAPAATHRGACTYPACCMHPHQPPIPPLNKCPLPSIR
jgi:hypothetical protein